MKLNLLKVKHTDPSIQPATSPSFIKAFTNWGASWVRVYMCEFSGCFVPVERIPEALEVLNLKSTLMGEIFPPTPACLGEVWLEENWPWVHSGQTRVKDLIWSAGYLLTTVHLQDRYFWQRSQHWRYTTLSGSFLDTTIYLINASPAEEGTRHCVFYLQDMQSAFIQLLSLELYADPIHIDWFCSGR